MTDRRSYRKIGVLDIGTSKVAAAVFVAEPAAGRAAPSLRVAGLGLQRAKGVKSGVLTNLDDAEGAVRAAVGQAERAAGISVDGVTVSVSCGRLKSHLFTTRAEVDSGVVSYDDIARLATGGHAYAEREGRALIHMNRLSFELDGVPGVAEPTGLAGRHLAAAYHAVTADEAPLRNLLLLIERCYLACDGLVATPYASALAVTTPEERQFGVTVIDLGAGTTSLAMFSDGRFIGAEVVPVGAQHVTFDIAKALATTLAEAERLKTLYGRLISAQSDEHETITYALAGEDEGTSYHTTTARLTEIVRPRMAQIMALVRERLLSNPASQWAGDKIVLTGGASQLLGLSDFVAGELQRPARLGRPLSVAGLNASLSGPQMAALSGLAIAVADGSEEFTASRAGRMAGQGYLDRVGSWLKRGF